jgi:hypothetical protein
MRPFPIAFLAASIALSVSALAQTAAENFNYSAPSGMFNEGTTKWQMFRFMHEDRERMQGLATGSVPATLQGSAISEETVAQPGRRRTRRTR